MYIPYPHHLKLVSIRLQDVVTPFPQQSVLSHLQPSLHVAKPPALSETVKEFRQPKLHHHIRDLLNAWVMVLANVGVEVPYHNGFLILESCQYLL